MSIVNKSDRRNTSKSALLGGAMALGGVALMSGQAQAQGDGVPDGFSAANDQPNVSSVERLADGGARITLENGRVLVFQAQDVAILDGYVYLADKAIAGADFGVVAAAAGGGGGGGAILGVLGGAGLLGAAAGGGGGGTTTPPPTPQPNNAPVFSSGTTATVSENVSGGVYTATATDADNDTLSYSIVGGTDQNAFSINSSTGVVTFNTSPDFENPGDANSDNVYEVTIRVSDGTATADQTVTITVEDVDEAPAITSAATASVAENTSGTVYTATATDAEGDAVTFSLSGTDAALFTIDATTGEVAFITPPDFENPADSGGDNVYDITVNASDGNSSSSQNVVITVTDVGESTAPVFTSASEFDVPEFELAGNWGIRLAATDADGDALTFSIVGGADAASFLLTGADIELLDGTNFEDPWDANGDNVYEVTVAVTDGTNVVEQDIRLTITDVNEGPEVVFSSPYSVSENTTSVFDFNPTDDEGDSITATISGTDAALFEIDATTFELRFISAPDFENPGDADGDNQYDIIIEFSDGTTTEGRTQTVYVTNVNEFSPVFSSSTSANVAENTTGVAYTAVASDGDNDTLTYSIVGGSDAADFTINASTGEVSFVSAPDFENPADANTDNVYNLVIRASDGSQTTDLNLNLTVTDQVETGAPTFLSAASGNVSENQTSAYVIRAEDAEGDTITYSISGTDASLFTVDSSTGEVSFLTAPDADSPSDVGGNNIYDITVTASDGVNSNSQDVAITVSDIADEAADVPDNNTTEVHMVSGGQYVGNLETAGDEDWIRIELVAGQRYQIDLTGTGAEPVEDTFLRLFDEAGNLLVENDDIDLGVVRDSRISFTATETGVYYIEVDSWDGGSTDERTGEYTLEVSHTDPLRNFSYQEIADYLASGFGGGQFNASSGDTLTVNITALTTAGQTLARAALEMWSDITGLIFQEITTTAQINFDDDQDGAFAGPDGVVGGFFTAASVNVSTNWLDTYGTSLDSYSFQTYIHEIGHALGLGHAGPYDGSADYGIDNVYLNDSWQATVMSYFSQGENTEIDASTAFVVGLQVADIIAARDMYGLSTTTRSGDTTYGFNSNAGNTIFNANNGFSNATTFTVFDAGGTDTFDYSLSSSDQMIDLREEAFSSVLGLRGNVGIANGTVIENAIGGSGDDTLIGNDADNVLTGNGGNDRFFASGGTDTFNGGTGTDTAYFSGASTDYTVTTSGGSTFVTDNRAGSPDGTVELIGVENIVYDADVTFPEFFGDAGPQSSGEPIDLTKLPAAGVDSPVMQPLTQDVIDHAVSSATGGKLARPVMEGLSDSGQSDLSLMLQKFQSHDDTLPHLDPEVIDAVVRMDSVGLAASEYGDAGLPEWESLSDEAGTTLENLEPASVPTVFWFEMAVMDDGTEVAVLPNTDDTWS